MNDNPTLADAMRYAAGLRQSGNCYADRAAVVLLDEIEQLNNNISLCCDDWAEDHSHLQKLCREAGCTDAEVYGDSNYVPSIIGLVELLQKRLQRENDLLRAEGKTHDL